MFTHNWAISSLTIFLMSLAGPFEQLTIPELVAARGGEPVTIAVMHEAESVSIRDLTAHSDLVVEGRLVGRKSHLSDDRMTVYTDYEIVPARVFVDAVSKQSAQPGPERPIVVRLLGGELVLSGVRVVVSNSQLRPMKDGARYLIFAKPRKDRPDVFEPYEEGAGVFEIVSEQRVESLIRHVRPETETNGLGHEEIVNRILAAVPTRR